MEHVRLRKYRGPETWARARIAYEEGQTGPDVARRFDVGLANLRKKATKEGWTRRHAAERVEAELAAASDSEADSGAFGGTPTRRVPEAEPPLASPAQATAAAVARAASALTAGRATEALALLKAAEALSRASGAGGLEAEADRPPAPEDEEARAIERRDAIEAVWAEVEARAAHMAGQMLADVCHVPADLSAFAYRWRAEVLGPGCEAADKAQLMSRSNYLHKRYWGEDGAMLPPEVTNADRRRWNHLPEPPEGYVWPWEREEP